jgi:hypothetical protein
MTLSFNWAGMSEAWRGRSDSHAIEPKRSQETVGSISRPLLYNHGLHLPCLKNTVLTP